MLSVSERGVESEPNKRVEVVTALTPENPVSGYLSFGMVVDIDGPIVQSAQVCSVTLIES